MTKNLRIETLTEKAKLAAGPERTLDVLVRITPPEADQTEKKRNKMNLGIALDRSGSMSGEKMRQAREAAKYCVDHLLETDAFAAVIFDDQVDVLFTSQPVTDRQMLKRGIDRIEARGSTALHEGWVKAGLQVSEQIDSNAINRVLLITDGQANVGETDPGRITEHARNVAANGVSTSTIGIGRDFNEDLLMSMAEAGGGNAWHVQEPDDMMRIFETELNGLIRQFAQRVTLAIKPDAGVRVIDVLNDFQKTGDGRLILPNLLAGSPLNIVVRFGVPACDASETVSIAKFALAYTEQASQRTETRSEAFSLAADTADSVSHLPSNAAVLEAIQLLMNARARREAISHIDNLDFDRAGLVLSRATGSSDALFSRSPSAALRDELSDLLSIKSSLQNREEDAMTRKKMAYRSESTRKGR
jgi:Ca-activated chloride channel family protein